MNLLFWFCIIASSKVIQNQDHTENPEIQSVINSVFTPPPESSTSTLNTLNSNCTCVAHSNCKGAISEDEKGTQFIQLRFADDNPCSDTFQTCCPKDNITTELITPKSKPISSECGIRNVDGAGYRNNNEAKKENVAEFGEFPWTVIVQVKDEGKGEFIYKCGGSLIHPRVVLTANHCVRHKNAKYKIRAGEFDILSIHEILPHEDMEVTTVIRHPEFDVGGAYNDIAILILDSALKITENVNIVCLPTQNQPIDITKCFASGWGRDYDEKKYRYVMKRVELPIVPGEVCQTSIRQFQNSSRFILHKSFICAGGEVGKDTCEGDGGSPLVCPIPGNPDQYYQAGIVSWGIGCGDPVPGVYVNVPLFVDWIRDELLKYNIAL